MTDRIELYVNGSKVYDNQASGVPTPTPTQPGGPAFPAPTGGYPGPDMWVYGNNRRKVSLTPGQVSKGGFTVPAWYVGMVEFPISGANFNILVDGVLTSSDARQLAPGPHTYDAELVSGAESAEGSIAVAHS